MGWKTLFGGLLFLGSSIKAGLENEELKLNPEVLPNGIAYYIDRVGTFRLVSNNDPISIDASGVVKHIKSREILYDPKEEENKKIASQVKEKKYRYASQNHIRFDIPVTVDLNTGKIVAKVQERMNNKTGSVEYRKWYAYDIYEEKYGKGNANYCCKVIPYSIKFGDPGIVITEEEFNAINTCPRCSLLPGHKIYADDNDESFMTYGEKDIILKEHKEAEIEKGRNWKNKGNKDGWYGDIQVKDGMVVGKRMKNENGETYIGLPYYRRTGGYFIPFIISYEGYLWGEKYKDSLRDKVWFR